ncbi:hypothetical protein ACO02O_01233 [Dirofilaria immitis]
MVNIRKKIDSLTIDRRIDIVVLEQKEDITGIRQIPIGDQIELQNQYYNITFATAFILMSLIGKFFI